jgi:hypothetical protein
MLAKNDIEWLVTTYPHLVPSSDGKEVEGIIQFTGAYDVAQNKFTLVGSDDKTIPDGVVLFGEYSITIRQNENLERLPKFFVNDAELSRVASRHFYPRDGSACVCGVIEEARLLKGGLDFKVYLEELTIPFLYGQRYYDEYGTWPWRDYAHDTAGALESYFFEGTPEFIPVIIKRLRAMPDWNKVRGILLNKNRPKGHTLCFCSQHDHLRRCHPDALAGIRKLYADLREHSIRFED